MQSYLRNLFLYLIKHYINHFISNVLQKIHFLPFYIIALFEKINDTITHETHLCPVKKLLVSSINFLVKYRISIIL